MKRKTGLFRSWGYMDDRENMIKDQSFARGWIAGSIVTGIIGMIAAHFFK